MFDAIARIATAVVVLTVTLVLVEEIKKRDLVDKAIGKAKNIVS